MVTYNLTIEKIDQWQTSCDIYAKPNNPPLENGDGIFIENVTFNPDESSVATSWDSPDSRTWYFRAVPIWRRSPGFGYNFEEDA